MVRVWLESSKALILGKGKVEERSKEGEETGEGRGYRTQGKRKTDLSFLSHAPFPLIVRARFNLSSVIASQSEVLEIADRARRNYRLAHPMRDCEELQRIQIST